MEMKKILAISIILFFIGVAVAPSINISVVKASNDNDLVEVTTQACGIKRYGNTTVKLTREQANELDLLFESIDSKLNNATSREESIRIYQNAIIELDKYGLLPQGMSIEQAQRLITGWYQNRIEKVLNRQQEIFPNFINVFCLLFGSATQSPTGPPFGLFVTPIGPWFFIYLPLLMLILNNGGSTLLTLAFLLGFLFMINPIKVMNLVQIDALSTDFHSFGLKGAIDSDNVSALLGYTGLLFFTFGDKVFFFGSALTVI
jgi:hypothetical protein